MGTSIGNEWQLCTKLMEQKTKQTTTKNKQTNKQKWLLYQGVSSKILLFYLKQVFHSEDTSTTLWRYFHTFAPETQRDMFD